MGITGSLPMTQEEVARISKETGFTKALLVRLYMRFKHLDKRAAGNLCRDDFQRLTILSRNPFRDRIIQLFFEENDETLATVDFEKFVKTLATFRPAIENKTPPCDINSRQSKAEDRDGKISRFELLDIVRSMIHVKISEEEMCSIVERAILEVDGNEDGMVDHEEFIRLVEHFPLEEKFSLRFLLT